jgi:hypothetical protein
MLFFGSLETSGVSPSFAPIPRAALNKVKAWLVSDSGKI